MKEKIRSHIPIEDTYDLEKIYKSEKEFQNDIDNIQKRIHEIKTLKKDFLKEGPKLYNFLEYLEETERLLDKIYVYAHLHFETDVTKKENKERMAKSEDIRMLYENSTAFVIPSILKKEKSWIQKLIEVEPKLKKHEHFLNEIFRSKKHQLKEVEEKILTAYSKPLLSQQKIFTSLTNGDMTFGYIKNEEEKEVELTEKNYPKYLSSTVGRVRKEAFHKIHENYQNHIETLTSTLESIVDLHIAEAQTRNHKDSLSASLFPDNIDCKVYENLISSVSENLNPLMEYFAYKKECLKLEEVHLYDLYAPLEKKDIKYYTFEEAKEIILESLALLGNTYLKNLELAFKERWIDKYPNKGKRKGAFSSGCYDTAPYILVNFMGKLDDIFTLAHELGHSMHTYYANQNNSYHDANYKIFVAEVASTTNELLLANYLLKESKNQNEKKIICDKLLNNYKATFYRQTMFAEFELMIHKHKENKNPLTKEYLCDTYYNLNKKYFGENVIVDDLIRYEWARIPHFYYNFYVYKYATGIAAATKIATSILNKEENAVENYIKFLSLGGSIEPLEALKVAGVDMTKKETIDATANTFKQIFKELKEEK